MPFKRCAVFCSIESLPLSVKNCFGNDCLESGQRRVPEPPAIIIGKIIICSSFHLVLVLVLVLDYAK